MVIIPSWWKVIIKITLHSSILLLVLSCGPDKIRLNPVTVDHIKLYSGGDREHYNIKQIRNADTVRLLCGLLNRAVHVSSNSINVKASRDFSRFYVVKRDSSREQFTHNVTVYSGNIVWYAGSRFRSDSIYQYLK